MRVPFIKMHGLGNDFVVLDGRAQPLPELTDTVNDFARIVDILDKRGAQGVLCGMSSDFMKTVFEAIHEESVHQQIEVMNKN